jgi:hypothetical protein
MELGGTFLRRSNRGVDELRKKPNGPNKEEALKFYYTALSDLRTIQNLYRDPSMHLRSEYDDGETQSAIFRVKSLMNILSVKMDENSQGPISWGDGIDPSA